MRALFDLIGPNARARFIAALGLSALAGVAGVVLLGLSGWFLTAAALAGAAGGGLAFNHLYPSAGVRGAAFTRVIARYAEQLVGHDATLRFSSKLRPALFAAEARAVRGLAPMAAGRLSGLIDDVDRVEAGFLRVLAPVAGVLAAVIVALGYAAALDLRLLIAGAALMFVSGWLAPRRAVRASRAAAAALADRAEARRAEVAHLVENAVELDVVGAMARLSGETAVALDALEEEAEAVRRPFRRLGAANAAAGGGLAFAALALSGADGIALGTGAALAILAAFDALGALSKALDAAPAAGEAAGRLEGKLRASDAVPGPELAEATPLEALTPLIATRLVAQAAADAPLVGPLTFEIPAGSVTLLLGASGAGKTTVLETLLRLHPPASGALVYGGVDWRACRTPAVLSLAAIAPQTPAFLPGTLRDQFRLVDPAMSEARIWNALEIAGLADLVRGREAGLDAPMGDGEGGFSGGELRRLGLARAVSAGPQLLALDEPFAGLEPALAEAIAGRLAQWAAGNGRALIIAQHDPLDVDWAPLNVRRVAVERGAGPGGARE